MDDCTDVVAAIEEFANIDKDDAVSALEGFVNEKNDGQDIFFDQSLHCMWYFFERLAWNEDEEEMNIPSLGIL